MSAEPTLADDEEADAEEETPTPDGSETGSDDDYEVAMTDQSEVGDPDGFFDGVDADPEPSENTGGEFFDGEDSGSDGDSGSTPSHTPGPVAERANATVGKLGVFGLEEGDDKEKLEDEFVELAETIGFGSFTERSMEKHLATTDFEDIDPVWGMLGAALILAAAIIYKRPDIDSDDLKEKFGGLSGALGNLPMVNNDE